MAHFWMNITKSKIVENLWYNEVKIKPTLYSTEMKLLKFEYTPLNVGLWYTDDLKPLLVLAIKTHLKKAWNYYVLSHSWI